MAMSNAERQAKYRRKALKDPNGLMYTRLDVMLDSTTVNRVDEMVKVSGKSRREILEAAIRYYAKSPDAPLNMEQIITGNG